MVRRPRNDYRLRMSDRTFRKPAPATFLGLQDARRGDPPLALFKLDAAVGDHPVGSTVTHTTLERHGYTVPGWVLLLRLSALQRRTA
ncbi:MAG TPA: hypothetical protein VFJ90_15870 [Candidatus Didemnitutus sp.]|nr:hypothetical protein [Candidatus Didemnitutus sp.]